MDAGREMDALVAERVMGMGSQWEVKQQDDGTFVPTGCVWHACPEFSTEIEDAWRVREWLLTHRYYVSMHAGPDTQRRCVVQWLDVEIPEYVYEVHGTAESDCLAICRAALAALEARNE